ncbi:SDR family NAD(P)-dependent oxidoreductase [Amycolatopsis carbonis]|uniref:SDR family NAD(P)-dependent oxidoreductase n=1 Tax=Amycolatopsis carbonis TaxID=715471 RepID=UPI00333F1A5F
MRDRVNTKRLLAFDVDLRDGSDVDRVMRETTARLGALDVVVNNAATVSSLRSRRPVPATSTTCLTSE